MQQDAGRDILWKEHALVMAWPRRSTSLAELSIASNPLYIIDLSEHRHSVAMVRRDAAAAVSTAGPKPHALR